MFGLISTPGQQRRDFRRQSMQTGDPSAAAYAGEFLQSTLPLPAGGFSLGLTVTDNETFILDGSQTLILRQIEAAFTTHQGKKCTRLSCAAGRQEAGLAVVPGLDFQDGLIEMTFACRRLAPGAGGAGPAFRVGPTGSCECFSLCPEDSRSFDQLKRNRAAQYFSLPDFPAEVLNAQAPGLYAAYADCAPGAWIALRLEVCRLQARLYVGGSTQPCLLVDDLRRPASGGAGVGLWVPAGTEAFVADIHVVHWNH